MCSTEDAHIGSRPSPARPRSSRRPAARPWCIFAAIGGQRVADVDLPAGNAERPPRRARCVRVSPVTACLARGIGRRAPARHIGADRAVVDDAPALRVLSAASAPKAARAAMNAPVTLMFACSQARRSATCELVERRPAQADTPALLNSASTRPHGRRRTRQRRPRPPSSSVTSQASTSALAVPSAVSSSGSRSAARSVPPSSPLR